MCVIIEVPKGVRLKDEALKNAIENNKDGWGLIVLKKNDYAILKSGETATVEELQKILGENEKFDRYLHLRFSTKGSVNIDNAHPFKIGSCPKNGDIYLFHNGTFSEFAPVDADGDISDTRKFISSLFQPLIEKFSRDGKLTVFEQGPDQDLFLALVAKFTSAGRILTLATKTGHRLYWGKWEEVSDIAESEVKVKASNNSYFTDNKRYSSVYAGNYTGVYRNGVWSPNQARGGNSDDDTFFTKRRDTEKPDVEKEENKVLSIPFGYPSVRTCLGSELDIKEGVVVTDCWISSLKSHALELQERRNIMGITTKQSLSREAKALVEMVEGLDVRKEEEMMNLAVMIASLPDPVLAEVHEADKEAFSYVMYVVKKSLHLGFESHTKHMKATKQIAQLKAKEAV